MDSVDFLLCDLSCDVRRPSELENTSHDFIESNVMNDLCDLAKRFIKPGRHKNVFCSALQFSLWWRVLQSLMEKDEIANGGEGEKDEIREKDLFEVEQKPLLYTRPPGRYHQNVRRERVNHKSILVQAVHFWRKRLLFSDAINNVNYDASEKVN